MTGFKTVRFVKVLGKNVNIGEWVHEILQKCRFGSLMIVSLGLSFTAHKIHGNSDEEVKYMYCPKEAATFTERFRTREDALKWAKTLQTYDNPSEFMTLSFLNNDFGEFFKGSGWSVRTPIAVHLWIQK